MSLIPSRKSIPDSVKSFFKLETKEPDKICPCCGAPLNGIYHISHIIPVISYGDHQNERILVAMHPECNSELGTRTLDISKLDKDSLVMCVV